jgi:hypothetical protein
VSETVRDKSEQKCSNLFVTFQQSMVISDIHSSPPSQMFESPLKHQDPRTVTMKLSEANRIMQQNNKIISTYEGLVKMS